MKYHALLILYLTIPVLTILYPVMQKMKAFENIMGKAENAGDQHFLPFSQCFDPFKEKSQDVFYPLKEKLNYSSRISVSSTFIRNLYDYMYRGFSLNSRFSFKRTTLLNNPHFYESVLGFNLHKQYVLNAICHICIQYFHKCIGLTTRAKNKTTIATFILSVIQSLTVSLSYTYPPWVIG